MPECWLLSWNPKKNPTAFRPDMASDSTVICSWHLLSIWHSVNRQYFDAYCHESLTATPHYIVGHDLQGQKQRRIWTDLDYVQAILQAFSASSSALADCPSGSLSWSAFERYKTSRPCHEQSQSDKIGPLASSFRRQIREHWLHLNLERLQDVVDISAVTIPSGIYFLLMEIEVLDLH